ncbi:hypothetical protein LSTR_LSTR006677 [Laodelphax striatellus]|uniref:ubiquitinyl hydrolase 1 n=1 Tax=Laodelphax striatellus TaxID=195883 RepID=A0A482X8F8_LAOST|nr:hypothetical protein LSTR_LSTR006677 [Laodelphax striatellus]
MAGGHVSSCPHMVLRNLQIDIDLDVIKESVHCGVCNQVRPDMWLCLFRSCYTKVCCVEGDHRAAHQQQYKNHSLFVAVRSMRVWCTLCNEYIVLSGNQRPNANANASASTSTSARTQQTAAPANRKRRNFDSVENADDSDDEAMPSTSMDDSQLRSNGLTGLQNVGNTCYMNAALQALSNTPPLTQFFLDCGATAISSASNDQGQSRMMSLSKNYHRLMQEMWHLKKRGYVIPKGVLYSFRNVHPMFRINQQQDTQEFLRCFMDQLHEELKTRVVEPPQNPMFECVIPDQEQDEQDMSDDDNADANVANAPYVCESANEGEAGGASSQSEGDEYETCDSGVSERSSLSEETTSSLSNPPSPLPPSTAKFTSTVDPPRSSSAAAIRRKAQILQYRSIISDVFDGKLLSSVQCLTCNRISTRVEAFQDLSLPIPSRDHLNMLHQGSVNINTTLAKCSEQLYSVDHNVVAPNNEGAGTSESATRESVPPPGWLNWIWDWLCSWFWGPAVSLHDCLAAFFSADELKGDNMYSCEKCNKLRNGVKFSKVLQLPEVLCIHLKRFRHDLMYSSKISSHVTFPLEGLQLMPYLHKHCVSQVTGYDLIAVICHHGPAGTGGHYTTYALNSKSEYWYEFDDQFVTRVSPEVVRSCEAYVLFYRKRNNAANQVRNRAYSLMQRAGGNEPLGSVYAVSKQWITRFNTFAEPGPIDNTDFLCPHARIAPGREEDLHHFTTSLPAPVWDYLYEKYGGGPVCTLDNMVICETCTNNNVMPDMMEVSKSRMEIELLEFTRLEKEMQRTPSGSQDNSNVINPKWFNRWTAYVKGKACEPPGPIDNDQLLISPKRAITKGNYRQLSQAQWDFLQRIYGGGPEVLLRIENNKMVLVPVSRSSATTSSSSTGIELDETVERASSGNWSFGSSQNSTSHVASPITVQADVHVHESSERRGERRSRSREASFSRRSRSRERSFLRRSRRRVSTSLVDIRIDSTQPSNASASGAAATPIHSSMPTVGQSEEGNADAPNDNLC